MKTDFEFDLDNYKRRNEKFLGKFISILSRVFVGMNGSSQLIKNTVVVLDKIK